MELKFTFSGAAPDHHDHGDAPSGIPLPLSTTSKLGSTSSVLELRARLAVGEVIAEALSGDGVAYTTAAVEIRSEGSAGLARALRSALSRAVAGLEGPMAETISAVVLDLAGQEDAALGELGIQVIPGQDPVATVNDELRNRTGAPAGIPVRFGA